MDKQVSVKNTKNEILEAYESLLQTVQGEKTESPQARQEERQQKETVKKASALSYELIVKEITDLKMNLSSSLDKLADMMTEKYKQFSQLQDAVLLQEKNLEELYQIKACADSLAALLLAQREQKEKFEKEIAGRRAAFESEMKEMQTERQKEQVKFDQLKKEQELQLKNERKREEEEYEYNVKIGRKKEKDIYEEQKLKQEKDLSEKRLRFEQEIKEREVRISAAETELTELRLRTEKFPDELTAAVDKAEKALMQKLQQEYSFEKELAAEKIGGEQKLKEQTILSLKERIKEQEALINRLSEKAASAENSVKDIALKALESSGAARGGYEKIKEQKE